MIEKNYKGYSVVFTISTKSTVISIKLSHEFERYVLLLISDYSLSIDFNSSRLQVDNYLLHDIHIFVL